MLVVDANVLLFSINRDSAHHGAAHAWLDDALTAGETVGFSWTVLLAFLRLATSALVFPQPLSETEAIQCVEVWLGQPTAAVVAPTPRHLDVLHGLLRAAGTAGNLVNDAHLAAMALEHGATVVSFDRDFLRFQGVRLLVPGAR